MKNSALNKFSSKFRRQSERIKIEQELKNKDFVKQRISFTDRIRDEMIDAAIEQLGIYHSLSDEERKRVAYDTLLDEIVEGVYKMGSIDHQITKKRLLEAAKEVEISTNEMIKGDVKSLGEETINNILSTTIKGKNYSDRIWRNKMQLLDDIEKVVDRYVKDKDLSLKKAAKDISRRYDVDLYSATRLINNEVARVEYQVKDEVYKKSSTVEYLERITMEDDRVSDICRPEHGKIYHKDDPSMPSLPAHVGCRCHYRPHYLNMEDYEFYYKGAGE